MKLVLLFFCAIFSILLFLILVLLLSRIRLNIEKLKIENTENVEKKVNKEALIYLELYLIGKIRIARINLNKKLFSKLNFDTSFRDLEKEKEILKKVKEFDILRILKIKVDKLDLELKIGTFDVIITTFLVILISSLLGILVKELDYKKIKYRVEPLYNLDNALNLRINCIISTKMVHIIYAIYILLKKGRMKNERTSNRRTYDHSYE